MGKLTVRQDAYLHAVLEGKQVIAAAVREQRTTPERRADVTPRRWWFALSAFAMFCGLAACSGNKGTGDTYARGVHVQEECCENLHGPARDQCLQAVIRVDDPNAQRTATNQQTYACITEHFVCDPATGHETAASAQAQHDCTDDLQ